MTVPTPDEVLVLIASAVREARRRRKWSQAKLAETAGVSLAQIGLLEKGSNVSVVFLSKVATALDLMLSLTEATAQRDAGAARLDAFELLRKTDLLATLVDDLRSVAVDAVLPPAERGQLRDTQIVDRFIERALESGDRRGFERLGEMIHRMSREAEGPPHADAASSVPEVLTNKTTAAAQRRRTKKRERE